MRKKPTIETSSQDDVLYTNLIVLLSQVRLVIGGNGLDATLKSRKKILNYLKSKQIARLDEIESEFFNDDGTLKNI